MTQVEPRFKQDNLGPCGCGCGKEGVLRAKAHRDGTRCVRTGCRCKRCQGLRNRRGGQRAQTKAARALGIARSSLSPGHEELMPGTLRWEHKSGANAGPVITKFLASRSQSEAQRPVGDLRPFVATFSHRGVMVAVVDLGDLADVAVAFLEQLEAS